MRVIQKDSGLGTIETETVNKINQDKIDSHDIDYAAEDEEFFFSSDDPAAENEEVAVMRRKPPQ